VIHAERFRSSVIYLRRYTYGIPFTFTFSYAVHVIILHTVELKQQRMSGKML